MEARDADIGDAQRFDPVGNESRRAFIGHRQIGSTGSESVRWPPPASTTVAPAFSADAAATCSVSARDSTTGPDPGCARSSATIAAHCDGDLPGPKTVSAIPCRRERW
jgi:hypothetical protein